MLFSRRFTKGIKRVCNPQGVRLGRDVGKFVRLPRYSRVQQSAVLRYLGCGCAAACHPWFKAGQTQSNRIKTMHAVQPRMDTNEHQSETTLTLIVHAEGAQRMRGTGEWRNGCSGTLIRVPACRFVVFNCGPESGQNRVNRRVVRPQPRSVAGGHVDHGFRGFHGWDLESANSHPCDPCNPWSTQINAGQAQSNQIRPAGSPCGRTENRTCSSRIKADQTQPDPIQLDQPRSRLIVHDQAIEPGGGVRRKT